jgi:hypothetical protein
MPTIVDGTTGVDQIQDGTVTIPKISATGTPSSSTFLRGDGSWQTIETTPTTDQVLAATAGASVGAVGTYAYLGQPALTTTTIVAGSTYAGSTLRYSGWYDNTETPNIRVVGGTPAGTWRAMGDVNIGGNQRRLTMFLRIS